MSWRLLARLLLTLVAVAVTTAVMTRATGDTVIALVFALILLVTVAGLLFPAESDRHAS